MNDITVIYTTANVISEHFQRNMLQRLFEAIGDDTPIIGVSKKILHDYHFRRVNIIFDTPISHINIYRQVLEGAQMAQTKYIAIAEDDVLYTKAHFAYRPKKRAFAYNANCWNIYTWVKPALFTYKGPRRNNATLICERDLYIETMEERFGKFAGIPDEEIDLSTWAEPGRYEGNLGLTIRETELFNPQPPNIMFSHPTGLSWNNLGSRKALGAIRAVEIPHWGRADAILKMYEYN